MLLSWLFLPNIFSSTSSSDSLHDWMWITLYIEIFSHSQRVQRSLILWVTNFLRLQRCAKLYGHYATIWYLSLYQLILIGFLHQILLSWAFGVWNAQMFLFTYQTKMNYYGVYPSVPEKSPIASSQVIDNW